MSKLESRNRRLLKTRYNIKASGRKRLTVHRTLKHISVQLIDDVNHKVLASASTLEKELVKDQKGRKELAATIGKEIAKRLIEKGIKDVAFDKGGYKYHGLIKILADSAREEGLNF